MKPVFVKSKEETSWGVKVGETIIDFDSSIKIGFNYQTKFNPQTFEFPYEGEDVISLNDLCRGGKCETVHCYTEYDINFPYEFSKLTSSVMKDIIHEFKEHGFNVTEEAVRWQYKNWTCDYKSGFRDDKNGYHLFSPCCCNPFSLRATTLHPLCADWQTTYYA